MPGEEKTRRPNGSTPKPKAPAPAYAAPPPALAVSVAPPFAAAAGALVVAAPSPALVQLGQFLAAGQPPPPALLSRALQDMRYPPHVVALPMANQVLHPEIQAAVVAQARQAFAASCAMMNGGAGPYARAPVAAAPVAIAPAPAAPPAAGPNVAVLVAPPPAAPATPPPALVAAAAPPACVAAAAPPAAPPAEAPAPVKAEPNVAVLVPAAPPVKAEPPAPAAPPVKAEPAAAPPAAPVAAPVAAPPAPAAPPVKAEPAPAPPVEAPAPSAAAAAPAATPAAAAASAGAAADGALASAAAARASASATSDEAAVAAAATAADDQSSSGAPPRSNHRPERKRTRTQPKDLMEELSPAANRRRTPNGRGLGSAKGSKGSRAKKPLSEAAQAALPLKLGDLVALLKADAKTRDAPRPPVAVVGPSTWAMVAAAAAARLADRAHATAAAVAAHDAVAESEDLGDFAPHRRPPGADAATRQHFEDAHRAVAEGREPPTTGDKPAEEPKDEGLPLRGKESLAAAVDHLLAGGLYGMLAPKRRCALLRALVDAALETKAVVKVLDDRARRLGSTEGALLQHRVRKKHEDYLKMRRAVSAARTDLDLDALPRAPAAAHEADDRGGHFAAAQLGGLEASSTRGLLRLALERARDNDAMGSRGAQVVDEPPTGVKFDAPRRDAALAALDGAVRGGDVATLRDALDAARHTVGCAAPEGTPADYDWRLRPLATAAQALRAREAADADAAAAKSDAVALGKLPPLRADHVGRDGGGHCYWAFRGEREYGYAPHRVWVQQAPGAPKATPPAPSWGYFGDDKQVANLAASLDGGDASEAKLRAQLAARLP